MNQDYKIGITKPFDCSYLPNKKERLLIAVDERLHTPEHYNALLSQGFRRSGDQVYRPHCQACNACQSIRILVEQFRPSKSQKRLLKKNQHFLVKINHTLQDDYYSLYEKYINVIHKDGAMYPASFEQYSSFLTCKLTEQIFIEIWHEKKLISVAVTDVLEDALSAVYTFYHPDYKHYGLGVFSILSQIEIAGQFDKSFLYLGYQIDACHKMNYKNRYFPHHRMINNQWFLVNNAAKGK